MTVAKNNIRPAARGIAPTVEVGAGYLASGLDPVTGTFSGTGQSSTFTPVAGRAFNVWLGAGTYTAQLECSPDGTTWYILTANGTQLEKWANPAAAFTEQWQSDEASLQYRLNCTAYTSGTPGYRLSQ